MNIDDIMRTTLIWIAILLMSCRVEHTQSTGNDSTTLPVYEADTVATAKTDIQKMKLLVVQCSNGYEFAMANYDFNPIIEESLRSKDTVEVIPFPYKKLMGVIYQGVYDRGYCKPILEKVEADYLIMTRFTGPHPDTPNSDSVVWGYETKILNTKTMNQKVSIGKSGFERYSDIEDHMRKNIGQLLTDIRNL
jgi:hypothetical protein